MSRPQQEPPKPIPTTATKGDLDSDLRQFFSERPSLCLGGSDLFKERRQHSEIFSFPAHPPSKRASIGHSEYTAIQGPYGSIPLRILSPSRTDEKSTNGLYPALLYVHGGGYSVGCADEFENGCRVLAEKAGMQVYIIDYRLAPEWKYPTQLNECECALRWLRGEDGKARSVDPSRIFAAGDSAGGNMIASLSLRLLDEGKCPFNGLFLLYSEPELPFGTPAAEENNSGPYLQCNGILRFAANYVPLGVPLASRYISPGQQPVDSLRGMPPVAVYTCGLDCLRDVGTRFAQSLRNAGNCVIWRHYDDLCHGFLQLAPWSAAAMTALEDVAEDISTLANQKSLLQRQINTC